MQFWVELLHTVPCSSPGKKATEVRALRVRTDGKYLGGETQRVPTSYCKFPYGCTGRYLE